LVSRETFLNYKNIFKKENKNYLDIRTRDDGKVKLLLQIHSNILTTHTTLVASAASAAIMAVVATAAATVASANK
jgi:hypothetical protein